AQCVKDDTMAESVAAAGTAEPRPLIVHFNGAFHSDYRLGTAARAKKRLPKSRIQVVSIVPVDDLDNLKTDDYRKRGDFIVFTLGKAAGDK
ncbi:MAG TPA: ChaN family lipoprotein, partial [Blastocatellia bacterium]